MTDKYYNFLSLKTSKSKNRLKNPRSYFRNGKWCKGKSNILNLQIFQELFFAISFRDHLSNRIQTALRCPDRYFEELIS